MLQSDSQSGPEILERNTMQSLRLISSGHAIQSSGQVIVLVTTGRSPRGNAIQIQISKSVLAKKNLLPNAETFLEDCWRIWSTLQSGALNSPIVAIIRLDR